MLRASLLAALLAGASSVDAFWRLPCNNPVVIERADPIISPGAVSAHVHNIVGGSGVGLGSTFDDLRASQCSTCRVKQDMSAYWTPQLYFQWANGSVSSVDTTSGALIYYLLRSHPSDTTPITAFPDGFQMVTGNPFKRTYDASSLVDQAIGWNCLGSGVAETRQPYLPGYNCPNGLRGEIRFPSCWDGVNLDASDHTSHVAYPIGGEDGPCPATHPVRIPTLFYEIMWSVDPWNGKRSQAKNPAQPFVTANGDSSGYGYHGDFQNGWDRQVLQKAVETCTSDSGVIEYCDVFDLYPSDNSCHKTPDVNEVVTGTLASLPGCNAVTGAGQTAVPGTCATPAPSLLDSVEYEGGAPPADAPVPGNQPSVVANYTSSTGALFQYRDCYSDLVSGGRTLPNKLATKAVTVEACLEACSTAGYALCALEYNGRECWAADELGAGSTALGAGSCAQTCVDSPLQYCGGDGGATKAAMVLYMRSVSLSLFVRSLNFADALFVGLERSSFDLCLHDYDSPHYHDDFADADLHEPAHHDLDFGGCLFELLFLHQDRLVPRPDQLFPRGILQQQQQQQHLVLVLLHPFHQLERARHLHYSHPARLTSSSGKVKWVLAPTTTWVAATTTTSAGPAPTDPTKLNEDANWSYHGCFREVVEGGRTLPLQVTAPLWTISSCLATAKTAGYAVAGVTGGGACWAATALTPYAPQLPAASCKQPCNDAGDETCGGSGAFDVYYSKTVPPLQAPVNLTSFGGYKYDNCYSDLVSGQRSLPTKLVNTNSTVEACLNACKAENATVCGLSFYSECWAGSGLASTATLLPDARCHYPCLGNGLESCGGDAALSIWRMTPNLVARSPYEKRKAQMRNKSI
ncbi:hypothetical protein JCM10207_007745 [Rhodosporidiobolus poonsookiae]